MEKISERLRAARIKAGYDSAKAAAEIMGVPVATYIQHENGSRGVPVPTKHFADCRRCDCAGNPEKIADPEK